jgi:hypothetical protein
MLSVTDRQRNASSPSEYPVRIGSRGIIPDDPDHTDDIVRRLREVLELIWKDRIEAIEKEACEILGVKELRDYFRKPGKGGFWDDHGPIPFFAFLPDNYFLLAESLVPIYVVATLDEERSFINL